MSLANIEDYIKDVYQHAQGDAGESLYLDDTGEADPWYMPREKLSWLDGKSFKTFITSIGEECTSIEQVITMNRFEFPDLYKDV